MKSTNDIPGMNPFKVPENYFDDVNRKIISAAAGSEPDEAKPGLYRRLKPFLAAAASVAAFIILSYGAVKVILPGSRNGEMPQISLEEFSETYLNDIDLLTLEENVESLILYEDVPNVEGTEIIEYLLLENINENEIYELL